MTAQDAPDRERETAKGPEAPPAAAALPFEYEDRSDGRHANLMAEIAAAIAWTRSQRAAGMQPN